MSDKKDPKKEPEQYRCKVELRHEFTQEEWKERTSELTRKMKQLEQKESEIKAQQAVAKSDIKTMKSEVMSLMNQVDDGYVMQSFEAVARFNRKKGSKKIYHWAPGNKELHEKLIREEPMTEDDHNLLPLGDTSTEATPGALAPDGKVKDERPANVADMKSEGEQGGGEAESDVPY